MSTLIILGGLCPSAELAHHLAGQATRIIAADSGYDHCVHCGITPDVVTGDFDSVETLPEDASIKVVPAHEQNATDFEKALRHVPESEPVIEILGGTGLRSDHFLTNLVIAAGRPPSQVIRFHDDKQVIHRVTPACPLAMPADLDTVISLIPFTNCQGVSTRGLQWDLQAAEMGPGAQLGQSNRARSQQIDIQVGSGLLFAIFNQPGQHA